jgi:hypothetical protein
MSDLVIPCQERNWAAALELPLDLAMQGPLVGLDRQEDVGPLLLELLTIGFWMCRASAWISTPCGTSSPSNSLSTARSSPLLWHGWPGRSRQVSAKQCATPSAAESSVTWAM